MITILFSMCILSFMVLRCSNFANIFVYMNIISLFATASYAMLHAYDVALTEVSVSCGVGVLLNFYLLNQKTNLLYESKIYLIALASIIITYVITINIKQNVISQYVELYIDNANIKCLVSEILASFRGFDTLCETLVVVVTATVILQINNIKMKFQIKFHKAMQDALNSLMFFIFAVGLYTYLNGEVAPGGAFQAAALFMFIIIIYRLKLFELNKNLHFIGMLLYIIIAAYGIYKSKNIMFYDNIAKGIHFVELAILISVLFSFIYLIKTKYNFITTLVIPVNYTHIAYVSVSCLFAVWCDLYVFVICYCVWLFFNNNVLNGFNFIIVMLLLFDCIVPIINAKVYFVGLLLLLSLPICTYYYIIIMCREICLASFEMVKVCFTNKYNITNCKVNMPYCGYKTSLMIYFITLTPGTISANYDDKVLTVNCITEFHSNSVANFIEFFNISTTLNPLNFLYISLKNIIKSDNIK